jgi:hypothetical protein
MAQTYDGPQLAPLTYQEHSGHKLALRPAEIATSGHGDLDSIPSSLAAIGIIELLECDSRPTFVVDLNHIHRKGFAEIRVLYYNASLRAYGALKELASGTAVPRSMSAAYNAYKEWLTEILMNGDNSKASNYSFGGLLWTAFTMKRQFGIVSGISAPQSSGNDMRKVVQEAERVSSGQESQIRPSLKHTPSSSYTDLCCKQTPLPYHIQFFRDIDWTLTSLGPLEAWSRQLRQMVTLLTSDPNPVFLFWTQKDMILIYNEAAMVVVAEKHPHAQGRPAKESFAEVWEPFTAQFASVFTSGRALRHENMPAHLQRHGRMDEW